MPVVDGVHAAIRRAPVLARPVLTALSVVLLPWLLAPICVFRGVRTGMASLYVAAFWAWVQPARPRGAGLTAAVAGALAGAWLGHLAASGFTALLTTVVGGHPGAHPTRLPLASPGPSARNPPAEYPAGIKVSDR